MRERKLAAVLISLLLLPVAVYAAYTQLGQPPGEAFVRAATLQGGISTLDIMLEAHLDRKHGFRLEVLRLQKTPDILAAIAKGDADLAVIPVEMAAKLVQDGENIKIVAVDMFQNQAILAKSEGMESAADLKGKRVAAVVASGTYMMFKAYLKLAYNVDVSETGFNESAVNVVNVPPGLIVAALERGDVDAIVVWEPLVSRAIVEASARIVEDFSAMWKRLGYPGEPVMLVWVARGDFVERSESALRAFLSARLEAARAWIDDRELVVSTLSKLYGLSEQAAETLYGRVRVCAEPLDSKLVENIRRVWMIAWMGGYLKESPDGIPEDAFYR
uniref:ABC transporter substrate-binding protein n=1 Tax=Fervidicoccus fontis TaxID=683846 RepID=A0A7J3ZIR6_9CREN